MDQIRTRMDAIQTPIIPLVAEWIRQTPGTVSLGQGVAYYGPPPEALEHVAAFWQDPNNHRYQPVQGILALRQAIAAKLRAENQIWIDEPDRVVVTAGSNMGFMNALLAITNPGDEIILPTPYYFNHEMAIGMTNCQAVLVPIDADYQLQPEAVAAAISPRTRAVVTISPNNPSGAVYPRSTLEQVNEICRERGLYHISDETYEYFTYDGSEHFSPGSRPDADRHTISLFSLSKAYGFASWRIGYMVIPAHLRLAIEKIQDTIVICPTVLAQYAALGCLQVGSRYCYEKLALTRNVRGLLLDHLAQIPDLCRIPSAQGAFYLFLRIQAEIDSLGLAERLVREHGVATIPGTTFGLEKGCYLRIAYGALQPKTALEGISRLTNGLQAILNP